MIFQNLRARNFLLKHGPGYSFRTHRHKEGDDWINDGRGKPKLANVKIKEQAEFNQENDVFEGLSRFLLPYSQSSGFSGTEQWIKAIILLIPQRRLPNHGWLYRVQLKYPRCPNCSLDYLEQDKRFKDVMTCPLCRSRYKRIPAFRGEFIPWRPPRKLSLLQKSRR